MSNLLTPIRHGLANQWQRVLSTRRVKNIFDFYEDFIGVKEVRKTQEEVLQVIKRILTNRIVIVCFITERISIHRVIQSKT